LIRYDIIELVVDRILSE